MTVDVYCDSFPLSTDKVETLLLACSDAVGGDAGTVAIKCVSEIEITKMNATYREKNLPTNVLSFSYDNQEHDVALCMDVAMREAVARNVSLAEYTALLLVHAFLHVMGLDHEASKEEEEKTKMLEQRILLACGYSAVTLFSL